MRPAVDDLGPLFFGSGNAQPAHLVQQGRTTDTELLGSAIRTADDPARVLQCAQNMVTLYVF